MTSIVNVLAAVLPALVFMAYATLVGAGVQALLGSAGRFAVSLGVVIGVGLSVTAVTMTLSHVLFGNVTLPLIPLALGALLALAFRIWRSLGNGGGFRRLGLEALRVVTVHDVVACIATLVILFPVVRHGLAYWTSGTHDYPNYVSSAQIWTSSVVEYARRHPDYLGAYQLWRAGFEKPMVTSLLVAISTLSATPPYQLLSPFMLVFVQVFLSCTLTLCARLFHLGRFVAIAAVLPAGLALVPMARIYDAQPGQAVAAALIAGLFCILAATELPRQKSTFVALSLLAAVVWTAAIGSNFTLVAGSSPALGALVLWILSKDPDGFVGRLRLSALAAGATALLSLPFVGMYLKSASFQTTGEHGFNVQLVSPLALVGQQPSLSRLLPTSEMLLVWCAVITGLMILLWLRARKDRRSALFDLILLLAIVANALVIGLKLEWTNYAFHKWAALCIATVMPLVLAYAVSQFHQWKRAAAIAALSVMSVTSGAISMARGFSVGYVASRDLMSLPTSPHLASEGAINLKIRGNMSDNMLAATITPADVVTLTERTYAHASPPIGSKFLFRTDQVDRLPYSDVTRLNDTYSVGSLDLVVGDTTITFTEQHPDAGRYLFGGWYDPEAEGTWSGKRDNYVVLDLPAALQGRDLRFVVAGQAYADGEATQAVQVLVNDETVARQRYPENSGEPIEFEVGAQAIAHSPGRVVINFRTPERVTPASFGGDDKRALGFMLKSMTIIAE